MALSQQQTEQLEFQVAIINAQKAADAERAAAAATARNAELLVQNRVAMLHLARDIILESNKTLPASDRTISVEAVTAKADDLLGYVNNS